MATQIGCARSVLTAVRSLVQVRKTHQRDTSIIPDPPEEGWVPNNGSTPDTSQGAMCIIMYYDRTQDMTVPGFCVEGMCIHAIHFLVNRSIDVEERGAQQ